MTNQKEFQLVKDLYRLLKEGVDDYWWTLTDENFETLNKLRNFVDLEEIPHEKLKELREYFKIYD